MQLNGCEVLCLKILQSRVFWVAIAIGLSLAISYAVAATRPDEVIETPKEEIKTTIEKPVCDLVLHPSQDKTDCYYKAPVTPKKESKPPGLVVVADTQSKLEVKQLIIDWSNRFGIDPTVPQKIAYCESGFNVLSQNKVSSAGGVFQFLDGTWIATVNQIIKSDPALAAELGLKADLSQKKTSLNAVVGVWKIANGGISAWNASKHCWTQ